MNQIDRYLAKLILVPLIGTLCLAAMLLILDRMLRLFDFVVSEGGPVTVVWRMLANLIPEYLGLAIPVGLTLGILLAFRKLALSSELDTLRAVGLGYGRLLRVPYALCAGPARRQFLDRRLPPAQGPICLSETALRTELGRARRLDQGRRVHQSRPRHDAARRAQRKSRHRPLRRVPAHRQPQRPHASRPPPSAARFLATDDPDTILFRLTNGRLVNNRPITACPGC